MPRKQTSYVTYINRLLHASAGEEDVKSISKEAIECLNDIVRGFMQKLLTETKRIAQVDNSPKKRLQRRTLKAALTFIVPNKAKAFIDAGEDAVQRYEQALALEVEKPAAEEKKQKVPRNKKAGVTFPVAGMETAIREGTRAKSVEKVSAVFLAGVMDAFTTAILQPCQQETAAHKKKRIMQRFIGKALHEDETWAKFYGDSVIPQRERTQYIEPSLR